MEDSSATLGVGFVIDTGGSFSELEQLSRALDLAAVQGVSAGAKVEGAFTGINLGNATAQISSFGNAATKIDRDLARAKQSAERAGERMLQQLTREIDTFGKASAEIRQMDAAARSAAASKQGLTELAQQIDAASGKLNAMQTAGGSAAGGLGATRAAMSGLSFQAQDAFTQISMGSNILSVLAIQGGQAAGQMTGLGGAAGKVANFMIGPWGLAFTAGLLVVGALTKGLFEGNSALDDAVDKLRKDAAETEANARAKDLFRTSVEGTTAAIREQEDALKNLENQGQTATQRAVVLARAEVLKQEAYIATTRELLQQAKADLILANAQLYRGGDKYERLAGAVFSDIARGEIAKLEQGLGKMNAQLSVLEQLRQKIQSFRDVEIGRERADPAAMINREWDRRIDQRRRELLLAGEGSEIARETYKLELKRAEALDRQAKSQREANQVGRNAGVPVFRSQQQAIGVAGRELQRAGLRVDGNVQFGYTGGHANNADHNQFAADVNVGKGVVEANVPDLKKRFDALARLYQSRGFDVIWNRQRYAAGGNGPTGTAKGHENHLHLRAPATIVGRATQSSTTQQALAEQSRLLADQKREYDAAVKGAEDYAAAQIKAAETSGLSARELRAYADAAAVATAPTEALKQAIREAAQTRELSLGIEAAADFDDNILRPLRDELALYGLVGPAREAAALALEKQDFIARNMDEGVEIATWRWEQYFALKSQMIDKDDAAEREKARIDGMNDAIEHQLTLLDILADNVDRAGQKMADAFGPAGQALGDLASTFTAFIVDQKQLEETLQRKLEIARAAKTGEEQTRLARQANAEFGARTANAEIALYGDLAAAAKGFFKEKSADLLMLNTSREMAASLRSIDRQIGGLASQVLRAGDISASGGVTEGFKPNLIGSVLGAIPLVGGLFKSLFGSTTTVVGSGIFGKAQTLGSVLTSGFDASYYSDVEKKSKFLGITTGKKNSTRFSGADAGLEGQFTLILGEFSKAIAAAATPLGEATSAIEQRLNGFVINIGKIELKGLTGEQVQEKLAAVFGAAADQMARTAFPGIERFQKAGEGLFETVVRVSSTVEQVTASLGMLGQAAAGLDIDAKVALADQFDSLGALTGAAQTYFERFYTAQEQAAARVAQFEGVLTSLGLTLPSTLAGFRALVDAQDLTSAAGQKTYATLLQLAPAFADLQSALNGARSAADILSERADLERKLLEVQGNTVALRALDLAKLDPGNRALQQQIWALQDAQEAARAADDLRKAWSDVGASIADEVRRIRGLAGSEIGGSFASAMGQFNAATTAARGGDLDAAKALPGLSQALLKLAADNATSRQELDRVQAQTAASLEQTMKLIAAMGVRAAPQSAGAMIAAINASQPPAVASNDVSSSQDLRTGLDQLREELAQFRKESAAGQAAVASNTGAVKKHLDNVTSASGGDALSVAA